MFLGLSKTLLVFSFGALFFGSSGHASCSMSTETLAVCQVSNGDTFTFTSRPECAYELYKRSSDQVETRTLRSIARTKQKTTSFLFEKNLVFLPDVMVERIEKIWDELTKKEAQLSQAMGSSPEFSAEAKKLQNKAREEVVVGGKVFETAIQGDIKLVGPLSCRIANK